MTLRINPSTFLWLLLLLGVTACAKQEPLPETDWSFQELTGPSGIDFYQEAQLADVRNEGTNRLTAVSWGKWLEIWPENETQLTGAAWDVHGADIRSVVTGDIRGDGKNRVYALTDSPGKNEVYEFTWEGVSWQRELIASDIAKVLLDPAIADLRGEGKASLYCMNYSNGTSFFEIRWDQGQWHTNQVMNVEEILQVHAAMASSFRDPQKEEIMYTVTFEGLRELYLDDQGTWPFEQVSRHPISYLMPMEIGNIRKGLKGCYAGVNNEVVEITFENGNWESRPLVAVDCGNIKYMTIGEVKWEGTPQLFMVTEGGFLAELAWKGDHWKVDCTELPQSMERPIFSGQLYGQPEARLFIHAYEGNLLELEPS